jgi:apolipoprotein N-acyltransferase
MAASRRARIRTALVGAGAIVLALCYGTWRLHATDAGNGTPMTIGLVSLDTPIRPELSTPKGQDVVQRYATAVRELAAQGAQMVVMPEVTLAVTEPDVPALRALAQQLGITLVTSVDYRPAGKPERNMSLAFHPEGGAPATYSKRHLMVGVEARFTPGDTYTMLDGTPRTGLLICKDMDFPATSRAYAALGAQLMPVPAWDFYADDWMHSRMAILRGVESGFAIARTARDGRITLSDDRGRVLAEASSVRKDAQLVGALPLRHTQTLYARWGDWFAWLDLAALLVLLGIAFVPGTRRSD